MTRHARFGIEPFNRPTESMSQARTGSAPRNTLAATSDETSHMAAILGRLPTVYLVILINPREYIEKGLPEHSTTRAVQTRTYTASYLAHRLMIEVVHPRNWKTLIRDPKVK
jgi:hypothetical protein